VLVAGNFWSCVVGFDYSLSDINLTTDKWQDGETGFCKQVELPVQTFEAKSKNPKKSELT
jgi:hypothetical protein